MSSRPSSGYIPFPAVPKVVGYDPPLGTKIGPFLFKGSRPIMNSAFVVPQTPRGFPLTGWVKYTGHGESPGGPLQASFLLEITLIHNQSASLVSINFHFFPSISNLHIRGKNKSSEMLS